MAEKEDFNQKNFNERSIDLYFNNFKLGEMQDKDSNGFYTYNSNKANEIVVGGKGCLPDSYSKELVGSENVKFEKMPEFFASIADRVKNEKDVLNFIKMNKNDNDFSILYALSKYEYVGENITFVKGNNFVNKEDSQTK